MKRDANGQFQWIRLVKGSARISKARVEEDGNITIVGASWSSLLELTSIGDEVVQHKEGQGIFMCQYNSEGKILRSKTYYKKRRETAHDFAIDKNGSVYIGGSINLTNYQRRKFFNNYILLKFDKNWELEWEMKNGADTLGESSINSLHFDRNGDISYLWFL